MIPATTEEVGKLPFETEAIHHLNTIQAYGALLAFHSESEKIQYVSENMTQLSGLPAHKLLNRRFSHAFDDKVVSLVQQAISTGKLSSHRCSYVADYTTASGTEFVIIGHKLEELIILEFEPKDNMAGFDGPFSWLDQVEEKMRTSHTLNDLLEETLQSLKTLLRYDRLMIYKFHEDGHGEVIAEAKEEELEPFLGLHYPATDIPPVAREIFYKTWVRQIANSHARGLAVLGSTDLPLNQTYTALRNPSACHLEYLQNMGSDATLTIAIIQNGKLWGLLACHHYLPKFIGFHRRTTCQLLGRLLSLLIPMKEEEEKRQFLQ